MKSILFLIASLLASPLYGQIKFSELPTKTAGSSTASQIFFPLVEMDGTPSVSRMSATELATLVSAGGSTSPFSLTLLDDTSASAWRTTLGISTTDSVLFAGLTLNGGIVTANTPVINAAQVWNAGGVAFQGVKVDIQVSAASADSRPLDVLTGGDSKWSVATTGAMYADEVASDPAAPAANTGVLFYRDDGSGKTQLCVRFPTGAVQVIATEP